MAGEKPVGGAGGASRNMGNSSLPSRRFMRILSRPVWRGDPRLAAPKKMRILVITSEL